MDKGKWILDKGEKNVKVKKNHETYNRSARVLFSNKCLRQVILYTDMKIVAGTTSVPEVPSGQK